MRLIEDLCDFHNFQNALGAKLENRKTTSIFVPRLHALLQLHKSKGNLRAQQQIDSSPLSEAEEFETFLLQVDSDLSISHHPTAILSHSTYITSQIKQDH